jgi:uncharacterized protein
VTELHRALDAVERRVLGCLVEKELSTPGSYPLSGNALVAACNQTTNRDPVLSLDAAAVEEALRRLMGDLLVWRERGARVLRWKHLLDDKLRLDVPGRAVLAELLLRGPQTPGELRGRSARMVTFGGLGEVEGVLTELRARGLVEELPRAPGQKERRWRQLLGEEPVAGATADATAEPPERHLRVGPAAAGRTPAEAAHEHGDRLAPAAAADRPSPSGAARPAATAPGSSPPAGTPGTAATTLPSPSGPSASGLERRLSSLEQTLAEVLARLARLEERSAR